MAWADFTKKLSQTTQDASYKMKKMAEISRLNGEINAADDKVRAICNEIGAYVINNNLFMEDAAIQDAHQRIQAIRDQAAANQAKVYELKGMVPCKRCGNMVSTASRFCDKCGAPVEIPMQAAPQAPAGPACVNCGAPLEPGAMFCGNCGTRQPAPEEPAAPEAPVVPETPAAPEVPVAPEAPVAPEVPFAPEVPEAPSGAADADPAPAAPAVCPACGAPLDPGAPFCGNCGMKVL